MAHQILHKNLSMSKVNARWVPKQLTEDQKASRMTLAKEHLAHFNHDENKFLKDFVIGDEIWVHYAEPETKAQSKQWKWAGSPPPKKCKLSPSASKGTLVDFWDLNGLLLAHFMPNGQTVSAKYYSEVISKKKKKKKLKEKLKKSFFWMTMPSLILPHLQENLPTPSSGNYCPTLHTA